MFSNYSDTYIHEVYDLDTFINNKKDFWVFYSDTNPTKSVLMDDRDFFQIPRKYLKAAAQIVEQYPDYDTTVKCTKYSNVLYDSDTGKVDAINETGLNSNETSAIKCRVHTITVKGHKGAKPHPIKTVRKAVSKLTPKSSRNVRHSSKKNHDNTVVRMIKTTSTSTTRSSKRHKSFHTDSTQSPFYGGVSH